jgi:enediyne biosynthesis protein E4
MTKRLQTILASIGLTLASISYVEAQPTFTDVTVSANVGNSLSAAPRVGTSATWGDYDGDGDLDLYVTNWASSVSRSLNRLYRNNGNGSFSDVASSSGMGSIARNSVAAAWADYDNDGNLDLYVVNFFEQDQLYRNNGNGSFSRVTSSAAVNVIAQGDETNMAWGDYNGDGLLDIYVCKRRFRNTLYHNNGNGTFSEIGQSAGVADSRDSEGAAWADYDADGDMDLYVVNRDQNNALYKNDGSGSFTEVACDASIDNTDIGRTASWIDFDLDGDLDLYVVNVGGNALYRNDGGDAFANIAADDIKNTGSSWISWTSSWADFDGNGEVDVFVANGAESKSGQSSALISQVGGQFNEVSDTGISTAAASAISSAAADYDGDFDIDLYVVNSSFPGFEASVLYRNDSDAAPGLFIAPMRGNAGDGIGLNVQVYENDTLIANQTIAGGHESPSLFVATSAPAASLRIELRSGGRSMSVHEVEDVTAIQRPGLSP